MIAVKALSESERLRPRGTTAGRAGLLPAYRAPRDPGQAEARPSPPDRKGQSRILVVDDDPALLEIISGTIERAGFGADQARNGEAAWAAIRRSHYDLVIAGNEMPLLTGMNLIRRLRSAAVVHPCLLISGSTAGLDSLRRQIAPGAVLAKPFSSMELLENIYSLLLRGGSE